MCADDAEIEAMIAELVSPEATAELDALIDELTGPEATAELDAKIAEMLAGFDEQ